MKKPEEEQRSGQEEKTSPGRKLPKEEMDYYLDEEGNLVMTAKYLLERGFCCGNGCRHCPYDDGGFWK